MLSGSKLWQLLPHDPVAIDRLARELHLSPIVAQLLLNRQVKDAVQARNFLTAPLKGLYEPELLPGMEDAVARLLAAVRDERIICVYGDYDVDGVTGTAILWTCLKKLGASVEFHVPHRLDDGYGLNSATLKTLAERGVKLVVTVDCGIASVAEADEARRLGLELIVTDHHEPKSTLPQADVIVHPRLHSRLHSRLMPGGTGSTHTYPWPNLCGAGVAFKLAWALCKKHSGGDKVVTPLREFLLDAVMLAAMGTVADVMPLFEENRILVRFGLDRLKRQPSLGLRALLRSSKLDAKSSLAADDIGYVMAPRINAAGRLGTAHLAVELLTTSSPERACELANHLEQQNQERQQLERHILHEARELAQAEADSPALVLSSANWHPGLLGIVASRLVDQFARPVLMIATNADQPHGQGSGRSVPGFALNEALDDCTDTLVSHGGHAAAAGFRVLPEQLAGFKRSFVEVARRRLGQAPRPHRLAIDAEVPLSALTAGLMQSIGQLEPYGQGNPQPLFLADRLQIVGEPRKVGGGERHVSFRVSQGGRDMKAIAFGMADRLPALMSAGGHCCLVFTPRINEYRGMRSVEIEVRDFQSGPEAHLG